MAQADFDPLTISEEQLKALPPAERARVYKARAAAARGGAPPPAPAAAGAAPADQPAATAAGAQQAAADAPAAAAPEGAASQPEAPAATAAAAGQPATAAAAGQPATAAAAGQPATAAPPSAPAPAPAAAAAAPTAPAKAAPPPEPEKPKDPAFVTRLLETIPDATWQWRHGYAEMKVPRESLLQAARLLREEGFDYLSFVSEVDWLDQSRFEMVYHLFSYDYERQPLGAILRADLPREGVPEIASLTAVWPGAEFMEREAYEMMGIRFLGHPDLRKILLPDDFQGFPMRKDYETDFEYVTVKQLVRELGPE